MPPSHRQTKRDIQKKHQFSLLQQARLIRSPQTLHADREHPDNSKSVNDFSIQRIVFPAGAKMLIFGH